MANPNGQLRDKPYRDALSMEAKLAENGESTPAQPGSLRYIARALLDRAGRETIAAKEVGDRLDGKVPQALEHSGRDGKDLPAAPPAQVTIFQLPDNGRG